MNKTIITLNKLYKNFQQGNLTIPVLNNINNTFVQERTYAITGFSGAGKSTLMHIIAGINEPCSGSVLFNNSALNKLSSKKLSLHLNTSVGLLFQSPHLIKELNIIENIMLPGMISNRTKNTVQKDAYLLLEKIGLAHKSLCAPGELSGGEQQRVALARALINKPSFLIADEPTGNLDYTTGKIVLELLLNGKKEWGMGVIVSSHDDYIAHSMDEVYELINGTLIKK
jgi:ABC-type lipoprotein export system ATPase subunit